jgi:hypothetical protein
MGWLGCIGAEILRLASQIATPGAKSTSRVKWTCRDAMAPRH